MIERIEGVPKKVITEEEQELDITAGESSLDDFASLYQVGNQDVSGYAEAANAQVFDVPEKEANLYKLDQQEVGIAANDEVFEAKRSGSNEIAEASNSEVMSEGVEAFLSAKATYEGLKTQIEAGKLYLHFLHEVDSAQRNIQVAESVAQNNYYSKEKKDNTAANAANFLNNLNDRLTAELARLNPKTEAETSYATSDVLDSDILNNAPEDFSDFESTGESPEIVTAPVEAKREEEEQLTFVDLVEDDPLMTEKSPVETAPLSTTEVAPAVTTETVPVENTLPENIPVVGNAEVLPVVAATAENPQTSPEEKEAALSKYQEKRAEWREYNKIFKQTESAYKQGLADYYERRGGIEIMRTGARSLLGLQPKFPAEVAELQARYSEAKKFYALEFSKVLALRGEAHESNADYSLNRKEMKRGMAQKFILKPAEQLLDLQKETALAESERSTTKKIMGLMAKHKWGVRVGTVVLAGAVGFASGGLSVALAAGGSRVVRMAAGMAGGALAGAGVNRAMKGYAETGEKNVASAEANARDNFDLTKLDELESELLAAQADKGTRVARRTAATVLASGAAGFGSGVLAAEVPLGEGDVSFINEGLVYPDPVAVMEAAPVNVSFINEGLVYPDPNAVMEAIPDNVHTVERGDNLWNVVKAEYAGALKDLPPAEQNRVLAELFERAKTDGVLRESIGLRDSNNLNLIYPGDKLELQGLGNELKEIIEQGKSEAGSGTVEAAITTPLPAGENAFVSVKPELSEIPDSTAAESMAPRPYSADGNYFAEPAYQEFALGAMGGVEQMTNFVNKAIDSVEGKQNIFDALQGKPKVFDVLKGLTVESLNSMGKTPGAIENFATTNGVEENILREWMHNFNQIKNSKLPYSDTTRFGDLFTRSVVENHVNSLSA